MGFPWAAAIYIGTTILSKVLFRKTTPRTRVRTEKFELPRTVEGEPLPIVLGVAELSPNFTWFGNITRQIRNERTLYYANAVGSLCHGPLTTVHDVIWDDLHLSAAPASTDADLLLHAFAQRFFGQIHADGPAISVPLPYTVGEDGYLDEMINALGWFGGLGTSDGQGGIAGRMHVHGGGRDQVPCELIKPWWGEDWVPGWPDISYVVFGGVPGRCLPSADELTDLMWPWKWSTDGNPFDGQSAGGGGAAPIQNGELQCFGSVENQPEFQEYPPHMIHCPEQSAGNSVSADAFGVHLVPPMGGDSGFRIGGVVSGDPGCPNCADAIISVPADRMVFVNTWQVCAGCTQGYNHAAHKIQCMLPGDRIRVRFDWHRVSTYNYRFPNGFDTIGEGGSCGFGGGISIGSHKTVVRPEYLTGWSFGHSFDAGIRPATLHDTVSGTVDWTSSALPQDHTDIYNNICYLTIGYGANWRTAWSEVWISGLVLEVIPGSGEQPVFDYLPDEFTKEGRFYWGTNARPIAPRVLASVIPTAVSGAGVLQGANPIDAMYAVLTNPTWGMGRDPSEINLTNLQAAAAVCRTEGRQCSGTWSDRQAAEELLEDLATVAEAIPYVNRETGLWEVTLLRPDYDVTLLPIITPDNAAGLEITAMPHGMDLVNEVRVPFRRWKPSLTGEEFTDYELGLAVAGAAYQLPGAKPSNVVLTQDGNLVDADDYSVSSTGVLRLDSRAESIDFESPEPLLVSFTAGQRRAGFEDAVATAFNEAMFHALGDNRSSSIEMPMIMDDVTAQRFAESQLLARSRPLKSLRWGMHRVLPGLHPGSMVRVNWSELGLEGLPVRILEVREPIEPGAPFSVEAIEEKYGFISSALIFHPFPERPPLDFPGDTPSSLGVAPMPLAIDQISPSAVRLAVWGAGDEWDFEIARTRVPSFYVGDPGEFGPDGCSAAEAPVYFTAPAGSTTFDEETAPDDGCPVYYFIRHIRDGYTPSAWLGPVYTLLEPDGTPADSQAVVLPVLALEEFEDPQNEIGYVNLWLRDPQLRIRRVSYRIRFPGEEWGNEILPPIGNGLFDGEHWRNDAGWRHATASVNLRLDDREIDVQWRVQYQGADAAVVWTRTTTFPLYLEPVWDDDGQIVTEGGEAVTASKLHDVEFTPYVTTDDGLIVTNDAGVPALW